MWLCSIKTTISTTNSICGVHVILLITIANWPLESFYCYLQHKQNLSYHIFFEFNNKSSYPSGSVYNWDFGDGSNSYTSSPLHTYGGSGTFNVNLTVPVILHISATQSLFFLVVKSYPPVLLLCVGSTGLQYNEIAGLWEHHQGLRYHMHRAGTACQCWGMVTYMCLISYFICWKSVTYNTCNFSAAIICMNRLISSAYMYLV